MGIHRGRARRGGGHGSGGGGNGGGGSSPSRPRGGSDERTLALGGVAFRELYGEKLQTSPHLSPAHDKFVVVWNQGLVLLKIFEGRTTCGTKTGTDWKFSREWIPT